MDEHVEVMCEGCGLEEFIIGTMVGAVCSGRQKSIVEGGGGGITLLGHVDKWSESQPAVVRESQSGSLSA